MMKRAILIGLMLGQMAHAETTAPGFDGLAGLATGHPSEALAVPAVQAAVQAVVGEDWATYRTMMQNPGKGGLLGADFYYGSACPDPACEQGYATLFVDTSVGAVYVAWTDAGQLFFRPTNDQPDFGWPDAALESYEFWPEM